MNVVLYVNGFDKAVGKRLKNVIKSKVLQQSLEIFGNINSFAKRIRQLPRHIDVVVLFAQSNEELLDLISLKDYLEDIRIILILPNMKRETISQGRLLRPRFIDFENGSFENVGAVLGKMIENINNYKINWKGGSYKSKHCCLSIERTFKTNLVLAETEKY